MAYYPPSGYPPSGPPPGQGSSPYPPAGGGCGMPMPGMPSPSHSPYPQQPHHHAHSDNLGPNYGAYPSNDPYPPPAGFPPAGLPRHDDHHSSSAYPQPQAHGYNPSYSSQPSQHQPWGPPPGNPYGQPQSQPYGQQAPPPPQQSYNQQPWSSAPFNSGSLPLYLGAPVLPTSVPAHMALAPGALDGPGVKADVEALVSAMKGFGTDEKTLTKVLSNKSPLELLTLSAAYKQRTGKRLDSAITSETSSYFGMLLRGLALGPVAFDAWLLHEATAGAGTDEDVLNEVLVGRTAEELQLLRATYHETYGKPLDTIVRGELSMKTARMFEMILSAPPPPPGPPNAQQAEQDARQLESLLRTGRTDELAVCSILVGSGKGPAYLSMVAAHWGARHGNKGDAELVKSIKKHFNGHMEEALVWAVEGGLHDGEGVYRDALYLEAAMKGFGTKDHALCRRLLRASWDPMRFERVRRQYRDMYKKDLADRVKGETSGDYGRLATEIARGRKP